MAISFGSINTGLPKDIVEKIMEAERIPVQQMEDRKSKFESKKTLVKELTKLVEDLRVDIQTSSNARSFRELKVQTNDGIIGVTLDKNIAQPGNNQIEVLELAQKSSAMTSGFEDPDSSYVGVGFIRYTLPNGDEKEVFIDSDNASLKGIAKIINSDESNGLSANVINDGSGSDKPWRLTLNVDGTGDENKATFPYFYFIDGDQDFYLEFERPAKNAKIRFNGFEMESPTNKMDSLIPGAVVDLKKAKPGEEFGIDITEDQEAVTIKVTTIIDKINAVIGFIKQQNKLDEKSDTSRTLGGDILLQSLESRIRGVVFRDIYTSDGPKRLGDLGIVFQKDGMLQFDAKKFESKVSENYRQVSEIMTGVFNPDGTKSPGFLDNAKKFVEAALVYPSGLLRSRETSLQNNIDASNRRIESKERMLKQKEENLKRRFSQLETTISQLKNQSAGLASFASQVANPVQQLG